jgi:phage tail sheath gpL-like
VTVPANLRVPFVAVEFDNALASQGAPLLEYRALIIGQKTSGGSAAASSVVRVTNEDEVIELAGQGSMLHRQYLAWMEENEGVTETYLGVLADNGAGVAAAGTFAFTGPATEDGTVHLYIGGDHYEVPVSSGDAATAIATAAAAIITADPNARVTAAADSADVDVTYLHKGTVGNSIDLRTNYQDGEELPAGVGVTVTAMSAGATNPALTTLITNMGDMWFQIIAHPYTDSTNLGVIEAELSARFGPMRMIDGVAFTAADDTVANLGTLGNARNSQHSVIMSCQNSPTPPVDVAAAVAAVAARYGSEDPARPFQTLPLSGVLPPAESDLFDLTERNTLLFDGISTFRVGAGDLVQLERLITTYKESAAGAPDTSYLDATTMLTLMYLRYSFRVRVLNRYPRHKLADDGTRIGAGQAIITPMLMKAEALAWFREMEDLGLVEGFDDFKANLVVERDESDPNRLNVTLPPNLINQLIVTAATIQFRQ